MLNINILKKFLFLICLTLVVSCDDEEPFDVLAAQKRLIGKWDCTEDKGDKYQITIASNGIINIHINNLCNLGENVSVNVTLLSEENLLIPAQPIQDKKNSNIEGEGVISDDFKKLILTVRYKDGAGGSLSVIATCIKK